jgi:hypothetical protein
VDGDGGDDAGVDGLGRRVRGSGTQPGDTDRAPAGAGRAGVTLKAGSDPGAPADPGP